MGERRALLSGADKMDVDSGADSSNSGPAASSVRQFRIRVKCGMVSGSYDIRQGTIKMSSLDQVGFAAVSSAISMALNL